MRPNKQAQNPLLTALSWGSPSTVNARATDCLRVGVSDPLFIIPRTTPKKFDALKVYGHIADIPKDANLAAIQRGVGRRVNSVTDFPF